MCICMKTDVIYMIVWGRELQMGFQGVVFYYIYAADIITLFYFSCYFCVKYVSLYFCARHLSE